MPNIRPLAYVGLGANLGDPQQTIPDAIAQLNQLPTTRVTACSSLYLSAPIDADGDDYVNAVVELHTQLNPNDLLSALQRLETQFGRTREYINSPRTLDLDLLLYEQLIIDTTALQLPHPRMTQRAFVLMPLLEIAPEVMIPHHGAAQTLLAQVQNQTIQKIGKPLWPAI